MSRSGGAGGAQSGPGPRLGHGLAHDARNGLTVLFGGFDRSGIPRDDTWGWDGVSWRLLAPGGPGARKWPAMAYDGTRGEIILFGGLGGVGRSQAPFGDTWRWAGSEWRKVDSTGPSPRDHVRMAWHAATDRLVLFGGFDGSEAVGDTWAWDGKRWTQIAAEGPPPRAAHAMVSDPKDDGILLFGGRSLEQYFGDTWRWAGRDWTKAGAEGPSPRAFHGMATCPTPQTIVLFGGWRGPPLKKSHFDDTWAWNGADWERLEGESPPAGGVYAMTYDPVSRGVLFHGGGRKADSANWDLQDRTWLHRDGRWMEKDCA